jgi:hypothetical protein
MAEVGYFKAGAPDNDSEGSDLLVRQLKELVQKAQLPEHLKGRGVNRVSAKVSEEIAMLFQYGYVNAAARQKVSEHHARRAAAYNAASCF